jgi:hypothetical protein
VTLEDLAARLIAELKAADIPMMLTGSVASSYHGRPRMTRDLDIVIDADAAHLDTLLPRLAALHFYVDADAAREALASRSQFNVIDPESGWKADLIIRKDRPFSREEFARREEADLPFGSVAVARPEDLILAKLEWALAGQSERQLDDVEGIVAVSGDRLDLAYLDRWATELGVSEPWERIRPTR